MAVVHKSVLELVANVSVSQSLCYNTFNILYLLMRTIKTLLLSLVS